MNAKKISALLLAAAMMIPCAAPAQVYAAEAAQEETTAQDAEVKAPLPLSRMAALGNGNR